MGPNTSLGCIFSYLLTFRNTQIFFGYFCSSHLPGRQTFSSTWTVPPPLPHYSNKICSFYRNLCISYLRPTEPKWIHTMPNRVNKGAVMKIGLSFKHYMISLVKLAEQPCFHHSISLFGVTVRCNELTKL